MREANLFSFYNEDEDEDLPFYDHLAKELKGSQKSKARKLVKLGKVVRIGYDAWQILPIEGYNKRTYVVERNGKHWSCNCQYNVTKGKICSHILAVWMAEGWLKED